MSAWELGANSVADELNPSEALNDPEAVHASSSPLIVVSERERRFATAYVEASLELARDGVDAVTLAYFRAFPRSPVGEKSARKLGTRLLQSPDVQLLVAELRCELSKHAMVPASRIVEELTRIGLINMTDLGRVDVNGQFQVDLSRASYRQLAAITEVNVTERIIPGKKDEADVVVRNCKIKVPKIEALEKLARIHNLYNELDGVFTPDALDRAITRMQQRLAAPAIVENAS